MSVTVIKGAQTKKADSERKRLADTHINSPYYAEAEKFLIAFWGKDSVFPKYFEQLDLSKTVELACGHARHTANVLDRIGKVTLVDINESNIAACKARFGDNPKITYVVNKGNDLPQLKSEAFTSLFCYDAMVHFEAIDVILYLNEIFRVLKPGGLALLHYSNVDSNPGKSFADEPHWRNFFSQKMMHHFASRAGFEIVSGEVLNWPPGSKEARDKDIDGVALLKKPAT